MSIPPRASLSEFHKAMKCLRGFCPRCAGIVEDEVERLRTALEECARVSGADMSDGVPSWPPLHVWAVEEVRQLRSDYDEEIS